MTTTTTDPVTEKAESIRRNLMAQVAQIKGNGDLADDGARRLITEAHASAKALMDQLRGEVRVDRERRQQAAVARLLDAGTNRGADAISIRDATERAERLETADGARKLLDRARSNGDETLVRAILFEARERSREPLLGGHWARLLRDEGQGDSSIASAVREMGAGAGGSIDSIVRFMMPSVGDLMLDIGRR